MKKIKTCKYCGTQENLIIKKSNNEILPVCKEHYLVYNRERHSRSKEKDKEYNNKKYLESKQCRYCGTKKNLHIYKKGFIANCCESCFDIYKDDKNKKRKQTNLEKYGVESVATLDSSKEKSKQTALEKYGVEYYLQSEEKKKKSKKTCIERYGTEYACQNNDIKERAKQTNLEKYGFENASQSDIIKQKKRNTFINNININKRNAKNRYWNTFVEKLKLKKIKILFDKEYYLNNDKEFEFECLRCHKKITTDTSLVQRITCDCLKYRSKYEDHILDWITSIKSDINIEKNKRFGSDSIIREADLYFPEYNFGIDFHGLYWHSDLMVDKNYHKEKFEHFKKLNISIIQIFENEWINKPEIVKSIIVSKLNINQTKVYARKTIIKEINNKEYQLFLEQNHIQGYVQAKVKLGMFLDSKLISVIGIGKSRFKINETEIIRYCSLLNYQITGGLAKFLAHIKNNYKFENIISYIDLRYFDGSSYLNNGFVLESISNPNYYYFTKNYFYKNEFILYNRIQFQKHKLKDKLEIFDEKLSEYENMLANNYLRIFDAGNYKLRLNL